MRDIAMNKLYAWVPWFNELAGMVADGNERELVERAEQIEWRDDDKGSPLLEYGTHNIDPFSFIYTLATHCRHPKNRARVTGSVANVFDLTLELPLDHEDAFYFPRGTPQNTLFHQAGEGDPALLWKLFRCAVKGIDAVSAQVFDDALDIGNVGSSKLTQALFLVDGREFLPWDKSTRPLLSGNGSGTLDWTRYRAAIDELRAVFPGCEPFEINLFAYLIHAEKLSDGQNVFQVSTNAHGDGIDHWEDFNENNWVYTGGSAPGIDFDRDGETPLPKPYPLRDPDRGDLVLVRYGGEGRGIAIVRRNDYRDELTSETRMHVLWLNKERAPTGLKQQRGFSRADGIEQAFRRCDEYRPTFAVLDRLRMVDGLTRAAVLAALEEFDRRGRTTFLQHYGYAQAKTHWIRHGGGRYDMKPIWHAAFGHMEGGQALKAGDEKYKAATHLVRAHLEKLGFDIEKHESDMEDSDPDPAISHPLNQILYGPPGTGKTWQTVSLALAIVDGTPDSGHDLERFNRLRFDPASGDGNIAMVTFHQNFAYEDFVEGIRPVLDGDGQGLTYELHQGLFRRIAEAASRRPDERFVLVIDEINRGNIARIFGELITLIEDSRRTGEDEETWVSLPCSQERFGVPGNLYLIGTMNTADRSIQLLDTALRRRFTFVEMMPDYRELTTIEGVDCARMLRVMNDRIAVLLDREHQIGHTYLLGLRDAEDLARRFRNQIFPLLQEYFFDDWSRIKAVLGDSQFVVEQSVDQGSMPPDLIDEDRKLFERLPGDSPHWTSTDAYRAIYEATRPRQEEG